MLRPKISLISRTLAAFATATFVASVSQSVGAQTLEKVWETAAELKGPESVVYDASNDALYVSNVNGGANEADGNGFLSKLNLDGEITALEWVTGLNAPKGMALLDGKLYVSDINELVEIDVANASIVQRYPTDAVFLNDVAAAASGTVYVSDMMGNTIYRLADGEFTPWVRDDTLENPNGVLVGDGQLIVGAWGKITEGFQTEVAGHLKTVALDTGAIASLGSGTPIGNIDGVEPDGKGNYIVTDWMQGKLLHVFPKGDATELLDLGRGSADHTVILTKNLVLIPRMMDGTLAAYRITE